MSDKALFSDLASLVQRSVAEFSQREVFGEMRNGAWKWITYADLGKRIDNCRGGLAARGIVAGDRVAVIGDNRVEWAVSAYATYGLGAIYVPMYQAQKPEEWAFILEDCGAKAVFCATEEIYETLVGLKSGLPALQHVVGFDNADGHDDSFAKLLATGAENPVDVATPAAKDLAGYIYTSGTTGMPKGVKLSHSNICSNIEAIHSLFPLGPQDRSLSFLPWAHSFGQTCELHGLLSLGASIAINDEVPKLVGNLAVVKPTILFAVPRIFNRIYDGVNAQLRDKPAIIQTMVSRALDAAKSESEGRPVGILDRAALKLSDRLVFEKVRQKFGGRLRYAVSGSAALSPEVAMFIDALGIDVYEGYGLSETSPIATANAPGRKRNGSVGKAIERVRIDIDKAATGDDKLGEIVIYGPNVMQGYHNRPEEQAKVFTEDGGLRTGDTGYVDADGFLFIRGRIKEQYKLENGKYVMPAPLEESLKLSPYITQVMLEGSNRPHNVAVIVADVDSVKKWASKHGHSITDIGTDTKVHELLSGELQRIGAQFKGYERPRNFLVVTEEFTAENGMLTPTMKLKRNKVMDKYGSALASLYA